MALMDFQAIKSTALSYPLDDEEEEQIISAIQKLEAMGEEDLAKLLKKMQTLFAYWEYKGKLESGKQEERVVGRAEERMGELWRDSDDYKKDKQGYTAAHRKEIEVYMKENSLDFDDAASECFNESDESGNYLDTFIKKRQSDYKDAIVAAANDLLGDNVYDEITRSASDAVAKKFDLHRNIVIGLIPGAI
jgi:hypothetical protein